jgi:hypothetical protein
MVQWVWFGDGYEPHSAKKSNRPGKNPEGPLIFRRFSLVRALTAIPRKEISIPLFF